MKSTLIIFTFVFFAFAKIAPRPRLSVDLDVAGGMITSIVSNGDFVVAMISPPEGSAQPLLLNVLHPFTMEVLDVMNVWGAQYGYIEFFHKSKYLLVTYGASNYSLNEVDLDANGVQSISKTVNYEIIQYFRHSDSLVRKDRYFYYITADDDSFVSLNRVHLDDTQFKPEMVSNLTSFVDTTALLSFVVSPDANFLIIAFAGSSIGDNSLVTVNITNPSVQATLVGGNWYGLGYDNRASGLGFAVVADPLYPNVTLYEQWNFEKMARDAGMYVIILTAVDAVAHTPKSTFVLGTANAGMGFPCPELSGNNVILGQISYPAENVYYLCDLPNIVTAGADEFHVYATNGNATVFNYLCF